MTLTMSEWMIIKVKLNFKMDIILTMHPVNAYLQLYKNLAYVGSS